MPSRLRALRTAGPAALSIGVVGVGVLTTGTVYALLSATGSGTASALAGSVRSVEVVVTVAGGTLHPGAVLSATPTFTNPNPFPVTVTRLTPGAVTVVGAVGCTPANSGVTFRALPGPWTVPASSAGTAGALTGPAQSAAVTMDKDADTRSQGATFTVRLTVAGTSS